MDFEAMLKQKYQDDLVRANSYEVTGVKNIFSTSNGDVEVYIYGTNDNKIVINYHGGGYAFGHPVFNDVMSTKVASACDCTVISVNYTKSVVEKFPKAYNDSYGVVEFVKSHHPQSKIILFGQSAGAQLATSSAINAYANNLDIYGQVLVYPSIDRSDESISKYSPEFAPFAAAFASLYCEKSEQKLVEISPVYATDKQISKFKNVLVITAENDNLLTEGKQYYDRIAMFDNNSKYYCALEVGHGFFEDGMDQRNIVAASGFGALPENTAQKAQECLNTITKFINEI